MRKRKRRVNPTVKLTRPHVTRLTLAEAKEIRSIAVDEDRTLASVIRRAVRAYLAERARLAAGSSQSQSSTRTAA
jgi:hypothetical protein